MFDVDEFEFLIWVLWARCDDPRRRERAAHWNGNFRDLELVDHGGFCGMLFVRDLVLITVSSQLSGRWEMDFKLT
jgi:hypothetical protein